MASKCPYCGSTNIEIATGTTLSNGLRALGSATVFLGSAAAGLALGHMGHAIAHKGQETAGKLFPDNFLGYHCKRCGKNF